MVNKQPEASGRNYPEAECTQQPRALWLADQCDHEDAFEVACARELRRLQAENEDFRATCDHLIRENAEYIGEIVALKEQRDGLLEAMRRIAETGANQSGNGSPWVHWVDQARVAIAKATRGETK